MISVKNGKGDLWPSPEYYQQLNKLYTAIGEEVYLVPLLESNRRLTFSMTGKGLMLLDVINFPQADPEQNLYPHMLIFSDGSGINLGKVMKVSRNTAFNPGAEDILYEDRPMQNKLMYTPRKLDKDYIRFVSRFALGDILGKAEVKNLTWQSEAAFAALKKHPEDKG